MASSLLALLDDIATVLDAAVGAGATTVDGIEFRMGPGLTAQASTEALASEMLQNVRPHRQRSAWRDGRRHAAE